METRLLLIGLLAAVVLASGCTDQTSENQNPENNMEEPEPEDSSPTDQARPTELNESDTTHAITLEQDGFEPRDLTIDQGDTVVWKADEGTSMWVASDHHPRHTEYSGTTEQEHCQNGDQTGAAFDQCSVGDRFSFTFEKTGEWGYHNHVSAGQGGTIVVK